MKPKLIFSLIPAVIPILFMVSLPAHATLGGNAASVASDIAQLSGNDLATNTQISASGTSYDIHEFDVGGTKVREYISSDNRVFAITWSGLAHPDLSVLLGKHAKEHKQAHEGKERNPGERRHEHIKSKNLVIEKSGRMRALQGRVYLHKLIPAGVSENEIQ